MSEGRREVEDWLTGRGAALVVATVVALVLVAVLNALL